jgi:pimeloyl-ACP methyl ester carboxylesterase
MTAGVVEVDGTALEYVREAGGAPPLVFLHEGLGSVELWRTFPEDVRTATGRETVVYSRHGHGRSSVLVGDRTVRYMHDEALTVLPVVLAELGVERPVLVGHSDGASIAVIYAGAGAGRVGPVSGLVLLAPHVFVEDRSVDGIEAARNSYTTTDLPARMGRYHTDPDATFWGWNRIWLAPEFRDWNIEEYLPGIDCPVLVVQGDADAYGTLAQVDAIERGVPNDVSVERLVVHGCGHAPHLERPAETTEAVVEFVRRLAQA